MKQKPPPRDLGEPVLLLTMADTLETDMLLSLLREQQIPVYTKIRGFGGYSKIMGGRTGREVEIYVPQQLYKHALGLVIALFPPPGMLELSVAEEDRLEQDTKYEKVPLLLWPWLIFGIGIVAWLIYR